MMNANNVLAPTNSLVGPMLTDLYQITMYAIDLTIYLPIYLSISIHLYLSSLNLPIAVCVNPLTSPLPLSSQGLRVLESRSSQ